jgi:hypothetical protein
MRKVSHFTFIFLALFYISNPLAAQKNKTTLTDPNALRYEDHAYRDYIRTVELRQVGWKFSLPIIELNSGRQLQLDFDDLDGDIKSYYYTIVHCDADWQPSDINTFDFLKGVQQDFVNNYSSSFNTMQKYTHYTVTLPNNDMQILLSGNYLLKIYLNNNPDSLVITRRFMVYQNKVTIHPREKQGIGSELFTKQGIVFTINTARYSISDPFHALQVFIQQNGRWDNAISNVQPQFVMDTALQYNADFGNTFDGGNEFRNVDMTSLRLISEHIARFVPNYDYAEVDLRPDKSRGKDPYITLPDIDGQYLIQTKDADSSTINSEYALVHFHLEMDTAFTTGNVYVFGQLSDWQCRKNFKMDYVDSLKEYQDDIYLKQGYYDYQYVFRPNNSKVADATVLEGNHTETENTYTIYVYYRPIGIYYDQLIGVKSFHAPTN